MFNTPPYHPSEETKLTEAHKVVCSSTCPRQALYDLMAEVDRLDGVYTPYYLDDQRIDRPPTCMSVVQEFDEALGWFLSKTWWIFGSRLHMIEEGERPPWY